MDDPLIIVREECLLPALYPFLSVLCILCPYFLKYCGGSGEVASTYHLPQKQIDLSLVGATIENISKTRLEKVREIKMEIQERMKNYWVLFHVDQLPVKKGSYLAGYYGQC